MATTNSVTGDRIISKPSTDAYRDNPIWDRWDESRKANRAISNNLRQIADKAELNTTSSEASNRSKEDGRKKD